MGRRLYVGNLPYETGENDLQDLFAQAGTVESVKVMRDMATGRARGFAFVEMSTDEEAQKAITELNDYQMGGRGLTVNEARPKPERSGGFGGGGGYGGGGYRRRSTSLGKIFARTLRTALVGFLMGHQPSPSHHEPSALMLARWPSSSPPFSSSSSRPR